MSFMSSWKRKVAVAANICINAIKVIQNEVN